MQIFQRSILNKYIENLDPSLIDSRYKLFSDYFLNPEIQENIQKCNEEQFQEGFLRELFVKILGYTINPSPNFNLITEKKNETDQKKADGAILVGGTVVGVIELKGHDTPSLSQIEAQAFGYKIKHKEAVYVVASNFEKLRFYIDNAVDYEEFDLFNLTRNDFARLWICLAYDNIVKNIPKQIKAASLTNEDQITNALYKDYSNFKRDLFEDILQHNPTDDTEHKILLFKKTQKLLDRLLFIFFAEDRGLLPPNSIMLIIEQWEELKELDEYQPFYDRLKKYFGYMNTGFQGKKYEVFAYNGGLFKPDEILDGLTISDELLRDYCKKIADYDFASDVDVNILGHIFENSLTEIEEITTKLQKGEAPTISKRKKDGVFYTPQYITKFIVENTVGKLCREKKVELGIDETDYFIEKKRQVATKKALLQKLDAYRDWLLQISICDPACGSGAFLNAALNFLIAEHNLIDEMSAKVTGDSIVFPNVENSILENNLYGVDINEESVEIAKLSLWLRTAKPHRKLNSLNDNIKCGNSLIDDPAIAGDKAFNWQTEFPKVFEKGGFDVVIGNPPYFNVETLGTNSLQVKALMRDYSEIWQDKSDILFYFIYKALKLSKNDVGFIVSNAFLFSDKAKKLRNYILDDDRLSTIVNFEQYRVFADASITSCIVLFHKKHSERTAFVLADKMYSTSEIINHISIPENAFKVYFKKDNVFALVDEKIATINSHIDSNHKKLQDLCYLGSGMQTGANDVFLFAEKPVQFPEEYLRRRVSGELINRYERVRNKEWLLYVEDAEDFMDLPDVIQAYLNEHQAVLANRADKIRRASAKWWNYTFAMHREYYKLNKIWCSYRAKENAFVLDCTKDYVGLTNTTVIFESNSDFDIKYILILLNSKLLNFRYKSIGKQTGGGSFEYFANGVGKLPIPSITKDHQQPFIDLADQMLSLKEQLQQKRQRFLHRLKESLGVQKNTAALERFDEADFAALLAELKKQKITLSLTHKDEWEDYFNQYKADCNVLTAQIIAVDNDIDQKVYELYDLHDDEIKVVEGK